MLDLDAIATRLRALQQALGHPTAAQMGAWAGVNRATWENYTLGTRPIPPEAVAKLKERWPITLDWVYVGLTKGNDPILQRKIDAAMKNPVPPPRGRRPLERAE